jgi:isopenicillin N synthase-like dioxygenase
LTSGFRDAGFIYLKNHGIPSATLEKVFQSSTEFFARPVEQKDTLRWTTPESNRGYVAHGREKVTQLGDKDAVEALRAQNPDLKESMEIGKEDESGVPNKWPDKIDSKGVAFTHTMQDFFETCKILHIQVMRSIALGLGLKEDFFDSYTDGGDNTLRLLHYPAVAKELFIKNKDQVRAGEHSDYGDISNIPWIMILTSQGSITLLFQDDRGGLQVRSPKNTHVDVPPIPGTVVINAGDLLARWSNDKIKSTLHRVVEPPSTSEVEKYPARYSIAYFCNPNFDKFIDAIPGTFEKEGKQYPGINSGQYLVQRLSATY